MTPSYERRWETKRAGRSVADESRTSYYNIPAVHKPHWKWLIVVYFFLGGISSASYVIASVAELFGGPEARRITRVGRYISLAALLPSPILLILDLGRPERFHHMLRVLKLRSPMSVGTWGLTVFGGFCGLSALIQAAQDGLLGRASLPVRLLLALPVRTINVLGVVFGFFVGGYTGVLLGATAVPLWAKNYLLLGPLFLSSAMSTAVAAITLVLSLLRTTSRHTLKRLERLEFFAMVAELGLLLAARSNAGPVISRPLRQGRLGQMFRWGVLSTGISAPLVLQSIGRLTDKVSPRLLAVISSLLTLTGGFLLRYVMVMAGRASADDPEATFAFTGTYTQNDQG
jgi:formate-dependent nitrite reductase membrane component NrfD